MAKTSGAVVKMKLHKLHFVNPKASASMDRLAERIVSLRHIQEMFLEGSENGYVAKVRFFPGCEPRNICMYVSSKISGNYGSVVKG